MIKKSYFGKAKWLRLSPYGRPDTLTGLPNGLSRNYSRNYLGNQKNVCSKIKSK